MERKLIQSSPPSVQKLLFLVFWKDKAVKTKLAILNAGVTDACSENVDWSIIMFALGCIE